MLYDMGVHQAVTFLCPGGVRNDHPPVPERAEISGKNGFHIPGFDGVYRCPRRRGDVDPGMYERRTVSFGHALIRAIVMKNLVPGTIRPDRPV